MKATQAVPAKSGTVKAGRRAWSALALAAGGWTMVFALGLPTGVIEARQTARVIGTSPGTVVGMAWKADNTPFAGARVRLRDLTSGRGVATTRADASGRFRFDRVEVGVYAVELLSDHDEVLAVGELFGVRPDETVATVVRLSARGSFFAGFFGNAAAVAIAAASSVGITAVGSSGLPASPQ